MDAQEQGNGIGISSIAVQQVGENHQEGSETVDSGSLGGSI